MSLFQGYRLLKKFVLFPAKGLSSLSVRLELEKNTPIDKSMKMSALLSQEIQSVDPSSFDSIYTKVGKWRQEGLEAAVKQVRTWLSWWLFLFLKMIFIRKKRNRSGNKKTSSDVW